MRRDLLSRKKIDAPSGEVLWIDHKCTILTSGYILDHEEEAWESSENLLQTSFGLTKGDITVPGGLFDLSSFTLSMRIRNFRSSIWIPLTLGSEMWAEVNKNKLTITGSSGDYMQAEIGEDFSLILRSSSGTVELFIDGNRAGSAGVILENSISVAFKSCEDSYIDDIRLYEHSLSNQHLSVLANSFFRRSRQEVKQFF